MNVRKLSIALVFTLLVAGTALAQPAAELQTFRADLLRYVDGMRALPPALLTQMGATHESLERADQAIRSMPDEELNLLHSQMSGVPFWRSIPGALAGAAATPSPRDIATLAEMRARQDATLLRATLRAMVENFRQLPIEQSRPGYDAKVERLAGMIEAATDAELLEMQPQMGVRVAQWNSILAGGGAGSGEVSAMALSDCSDDGFPSAIWCAITEIVNEIGRFFTTTLPNAATSAFNSIKNIFTDLVGDIPDTFNEIVNTLGLSSVDWEDVATTALGYVRLPCPPDHFLLPGFGRVGEIETWTNFSGTIGFAGNTITDLTPSDVLTSLDLQAVMLVINFPIQWLSRCLEESWNDAFDAAQEAHRTHVETNLDTQASLLTSQAQVDGVTGQVAALDLHTAQVAGKVDGLNVDDYRIEDKIDNLQFQQGQTNDILLDMRTRFVRMLIEADLYRNANSRISLFQLPESVGGFHEVARAIVQETLAARAAAGMNLSKAQKDFAQSQAEFSAGNYKSAYSLLRSAYQSSLK